MTIDENAYRAPDGHAGHSRWPLKEAYIWPPVVLVAGVSFWIPSIVTHAILGSRFDVLGVLLATVACPALAMITLALLWCVPMQCTLAARSLVFLLGLWLSGPLCMMLVASIIRGGVSSIDPNALILLTICFPVTTPMMATYDGSLAALAIITICLAGVSAVSLLWSPAKQRL